MGMVSAEGLSRSFGDVVAVDGVDLEVGEGEIYGFLGPNGAGKSTCVRMLCTLLRPTAGRATVAGFDVATDADSVRLRIGVALQDAALDVQLTGRELLTIQGRLYGLRKNEIAQRIDEVSRITDYEAIDRRIGEYSGGMKRRLDLAASLMHNPEMLFLDEPTTGLDPVSRNNVWEEVRRLNTELGMTIFLTTQYLEEADVLADRVGIIDKGKIVSEGTPDALKRSIGSDVIVVRHRSDPAAAAAAVANLDVVTSVDSIPGELQLSVESGASAVSPVAVALDQAEVRVEDLTLRTPTLDDVFLEVTGARMAQEESS